MAITIGSNIASLQAQRRLGSATQKLSSIYERLSSGQRINRASDDAAGLAVALSLNVDSRVFTQGIRNLNDGVSASNIAEGALNSLKDISMRQLELIEQSSNGVYSSKQRQALNTEANSLVDEYNRIVNTTTFNGLSLLDPALGTVILQAGYGTNGTMQLGLSDQLKRAVGDGTFQPASSVVGLNDPRTVVTGDFNNDGKIDIFESQFGNSYVNVLLNNGNGTFAGAAAIHDAGAFPLDAVTGDFNGDGNLDVVSLDGNQTLSVLIGNGNGTFKTPTGVALGINALGVNAADLNGDGLTDIVVSDGAQYVIVFMGNGNGIFQSGTSYSTVAGAVLNSSIGDVNGDGKLDVVTIDNGGSVSVLLGNGDGTLQSALTFQTGGAFPQALSLGDLNGDGKLDIVTGDYTGKDIGILLGNGNGTFAKAVTYSTGSKGPSESQVGKAVAITDLNGDGRLDIVTAISLNNVIETFLGNGDGTFQSMRSFATAGALQLSGSVALGDFNGDGRTDVATADYDGGDIGILLANGGYTSTSQYLNLNTRQSSLDAFSVVQGNLSRILSQQGSIGATVSRLQTGLNTLSTQRENFLAAASRITDVDVAEQSAELVRTQILQQAAASILAQANQQPSLALQLLKG